MEIGTTLGEKIKSSPLRHTVFVGASFNPSTKVAGVGMVIHATNGPGRNGPVTDERSEAHKKASQKEMELFAIIRALELARREGWRLVRIRSVSPLRKRLNADLRDGVRPDEEGFIGDILGLAIQFDKVEFRYVARRKNQAAMRLARNAAGTRPKKHREVDDEPEWWEIEAGLLSMVGSVLTDDEPAF